MPTSYVVAFWGCRSGLNPPAEPGRLVSSVVVGVSNDVPTLAYTVTASDGVTAAPSEVEAGSMGGAARVDVREGGGILEVPPQPEQGERGFAASRERVVQRRSALCLPHVLAGVQRDIAPGGRVGVGRQFLGGERAGIIGARIVAVVRHDREGPRRREREVEPPVQVADIGAAVLALAVVREL